MIEVPEKQSVRKLTQWLSEFGEQNRKHFEKNQLKAPMTKVGYRIYNIEKRLSASFESSSSTGGSSTPLCDAELQFSSAVQAREPSALIKLQPWDGIRHIPSDELDPPQLPKVSNQLMPLVTSSANDPFAGDALAWHPNARQTVSVSEDSVTDDMEDDEDEDYLDGLSIHTGRYTDPGSNGTWSSTHVSGSSSRTTMVPNFPPQFQSKDDTAVIKPKSFCISHKKLLCKSPPKESRQDSMDWDTTPSVRDLPEKHYRPDNVCSAASEQAALVDHHATTFCSKPGDGLCGDTLSPASFSGLSHEPGGAAVSLSLQPSDALDDRLSSIFAEETKKMNQQAVLNAQYGIGRRFASIMDGEFTPPTTTLACAVASSRATKPPTYPYFGALLKKGAVEVRKEELERKWSQNRPPSHVKKVSWHVSSKGGGYKKKVFLDFK
jgi:hypothetical protein